MNSSTESNAVTTGSPDELAKKYLELAYSYKRLELESFRLKTAFELVLRHMDSLTVPDENFKKFILKRLHDAVKSFDREFDDIKASVKEKGIIEP